MKTLLLLFLLLTACSKVDTQPQGIDFSKIPMEKALILNCVPNGGGDGTTDWINATNGLAQFWGKDYPNISYPSKCEVLSGNGFSGNYQLIENVQQFELYSCALYFPNKTYELSFDYTSIWFVVVCIRTTKTCGFQLTLLAPTKNVIHFSKTFTSNVVQIVFYNQIDPNGCQFCIDSINLKEL